MIDRGDPHWISAIRSAYFGYFGWDRLECKCQVGSSRSVNRKCLLSPEFVNVLVQCCIDFGSSAAIVMTVEMLAGYTRGGSKCGLIMSYRAGRFEKVVPKMSDRLFTVPFVGGTATARGVRP